jgi:hypothetical protein
MGPRKTELNPKRIKPLNKRKAIVFISLVPGFLLFGECEPGLELLHRARNHRTRREKPSYLCVDESALRDQNAINNVDDAVGGQNIGKNYFDGIVEKYAIISDCDMYITSLKGWG